MFSCETSRQLKFWIQYRLFLSKHDFLGRYILFIFVTRRCVTSFMVCVMFSPFMCNLFSGAEE
jgi:hypothetical protein